MMCSCRHFIKADAFTLFVKREKIMVFSLCFLFASLLFGPAPVHAESLETLFQTGNKFFWDGNFEKAAESYRRLESLGVRSAGLSYNLATAQARQGNLGVAILHYERVLARDPMHEDAIFNLALIRDFIARRANEAGRDADLAPTIGPWRAVLDRFSPQSATLTFLLIYLTFFAVLTGRRFVHAEMPRLTLGVLTGVLLMLSFATGAVVFGKWDQETNLHEAVAISRGTLSVMEGPSSEKRRFALEEGSHVRVIETHEDWAKIRDDQGRDGWVRNEFIGEI